MDRRFYSTNEGLQGLAVLSKAQIVLADGYPLASAGQQTGLQRVIIRPDEGEITLYNTWLGVLVEDVGGGTINQQEQDQRRQLEEILRIVNSHGQNSLTSVGRVVLGGTFNNVPSSDLIQRILSLNWVSDPFADQPSATSNTFVQTSRLARFDYIFTNILALGSGVIENIPASDHRMRL